MFRINVISSRRINMMVKTYKYIYIFEFKLDRSVEDTLRQINDKDYDIPYQTDDLRLFKIGVNFSSEKRNIERWAILD